MYDNSIICTSLKMFKVSILLAFHVIWALLYWIIFEG